MCVALILFVYNDNLTVPQKGVFLKLGYLEKPLSHFYYQELRVCPMRSNFLVCIVKDRKLANHIAVLNKIEIENVLNYG